MFHDEAVAQEKTGSPSSVIFGNPGVAPSQQGWSTVGGKSSGKGANPWGSSQSRKSLTLQRVTPVLSFRFSSIFALCLNDSNGRSPYSQGHPVSAGVESCG
jgi:hypothetical protein